MPRVPLQHRFQIVVGVVGGHEDGDPLFCHDAAKKGVPRSAGGGFQALSARCRHGGDVHAVKDQLHPQLGADPLTEGQVAVGLLTPYAVVQMGRHHLPPALLAVALQKGAESQLQKESGIRAARESDETGKGVGEGEGGHGNSFKEKSEK